MDAQPFRTISEAPPTVSRAENKQKPAQTPTPVDAHDGVEPGLSIYQEIKGHPFTQEVFGLSMFLQDSHYPTVEADMHLVEDFIKDKVKERGLANTTASYLEVLDELNEEIGVYKNEQPFERFKRICAAIKAINSLRSVHKEPILSPKALSLQEYEAIKGINRG